MEFDEELNGHSPLGACSYQLLVSPKQPTTRTFTCSQVPKATRVARQKIKFLGRCKVVGQALIETLPLRRIDLSCSPELASSLQLVRTRRGGPELDLA